MVLKMTDIRATTIPDAWFKSIDRVLQEGRIWTVQGVIDESKGDTADRSHIGSGSYVGSKRWEFEHLRIHITHPGSRPLVPEVPADIPPPADMEYVQNYYRNYLAGDLKSENETYTYGERIVPQLPVIIDKFYAGHGTNQCCIAVAKPEDIFLPDPPCMRMLDFRVYPSESLRDGEEKALHMTVYFRSWDLWSGLPNNLAALRLLQESLASFLGIPAGEIIALSKGAHLYDSEVDFAKLRTAYIKE